MLEKEKKKSAYFAFNGRKIVSSHTDRQVLQDRDGKTMYIFEVNYLRIRIPKDWIFIDYELIRQQLEDAGWIVVENPTDYVSSIEIPEDTIINGKKPDVVNSVHSPGHLFNHFADEELIVCLWPTNKKPNTSYGKQFELVSYLNSFDTDYIIKYLECFIFEKSEDIILPLSRLIYEKFKEEMPTEVKEYIEEMSASFDKGTTVTLK